MMERTYSCKVENQYAQSRSSQPLGSLPHYTEDRRSQDEEWSSLSFRLRSSHADAA